MNSRSQSLSNSTTFDAFERRLQQLIRRGSMLETSSFAATVDQIMRSDPTVEGGLLSLAAELARAAEKLEGSPQAEQYRCASELIFEACQSESLTMPVI